jgi:hypothetical protein
VSMLIGRANGLTGERPVGLVGQSEEMCLLFESVGVVKMVKTDGYYLLRHDGPLGYEYKVVAALDFYYAQVEQSRKPDVPMPGMMVAVLP